VARRGTCQAVEQGWLAPGQERLATVILVVCEIHLGSPSDRRLVARRRESVSCYASVCNQIDQALRDDLPRLFDQFVNNLTGRLDLADQANALTR